MAPTIRRFNWRRDRKAALQFQYETYERNFPGFRVDDVPPLRLFVHIRNVPIFVVVMVFSPETGLMHLSTIPYPEQAFLSPNMNDNPHPLESAYYTRLLVSLCDVYPTHFPPMLNLRFHNV